MKEVTFLDRVPTYPGRVVLTPVSGQANTFDMVRADSPRVAGTPLDKATFESVVHSRLTGRYYAPTVTKSAESEITNLNANPIPATWQVADNRHSYFEAWEVSANSASTPPHYAVNGVSNNGWQSGEGITHSITLNTGGALKVKKMRVNCGAVSQSINTMTIQGSNNGQSWVDLLSVSKPSTAATEYTISSPAYYSHYRLAFEMSYQTGAVIVREWAFTQHDITTYKNALFIADGVPSSWTDLQVITFRTPDDLSTLGVVSNTLNGYPVDVILKPARLCKAVFSANTFIATEV